MLAFVMIRKYSAYELSIIVCLFLPSVFAYAIGDDRHLFVLSGQSNMARLDQNNTFRKVLEGEFGIGSVEIIKFAEEGQSIKRWFAGWKPELEKKWVTRQGGSPEDIGDLYRILLQDVRAKMSGTEFKTITFVWMQGEADTKSYVYGSAYMSSLIGLINQLRKDLGRNDINYVIGRISDYGMENDMRPSWEHVRKVQVIVADSDQYVGWVDTDDLNDNVYRNGEFLMNDIHYSQAGYEILGARLAKKAIELIRRNSP